MVTFYDYSGKKVYNREVTRSNTKINVSNLSSGVYFVKVISDEKTGLKKFIKQ